LDTWQSTESALKTQETLTSMISILHISNCQIWFHDSKNSLCSYLYRGGVCITTQWRSYTKVFHIRYIYNISHSPYRNNPCVSGVTLLFTWRVNFITYTSDKTCNVF